MSEILTNVPMRIITGLCQTSSRHDVDYLIDLASMRVTNQTGLLAQAIAGGRLCTIKSRTALSTDRAGMGVDYPVYEQFAQETMDSVRNRRMPPPIPVTQGGRWAQEIQESTGGMPLAFECMDWVHAMLLINNIAPGKGIVWTPSVMTLGAPVQMISELAGSQSWEIGIKNGKWNPGKDCDKDTLTSLENTWVGMATYALGVTQIPQVIMLIERGMDIPEKGTWRNYPDHESARKAKHELLKIIKQRRLEQLVEVKVAYDPSHTNGPKRRDLIVYDAIEAAKIIDGDKPLYDTLLVESKDKGALDPLSDAGQHITGEDIQDMVNKIAQVRPIQGFK